MTHSLLLATALVLGPGQALSAGNHTRQLEVAGLKRSYFIHVPPSYDAARPMPLVMALHGLSMDAVKMIWFTGLNRHADQEGFIVVYPNGTGPVEVLRSWNAGAFPGDETDKRPDDVAFLSRVLDDAQALLAVDPQRVFVTGMSNGAMMAYRLAAALSQRIAAIAPVAGTLAIDDCRPQRPVPVIHFHGTADALVPFGGPKDKFAEVVRFKSVDDSIKTWVKLNGCKLEPVVSELPMQRDKRRVVCKRYNNGKDNSEVVLYVIEGGGHCWPGMHRQPFFLGPSTDNINANELMWEFFKKHPLRPAAR